MRTAFPRAAEVLEDRAAPSESILSLVTGGLLMGMLPETPGEASPPLSQSFFSHPTGQPDWQFEWQTHPLKQIGEPA
jgi:hypothetical protein